MLDINRIRKEPEQIRSALLKRMESVDFKELLQWDSRRRELITETEKKKALRNKVSAMIPLIKKEGGDVTSKIEEMKKLSEEIKKTDSEINVLEDSIQGFLELLPNLPAEDVPAGGRENNVALRYYGEKPEFDFEPKDHIELVTSLGLIDYQRGAKIGGSGFWAYTGAGARLEWGLLNYFIEEHIKDGYQFVLPPHILTWECGYTAGQFPKFANDVYTLDTEDDRLQFMLPTAETAMASFHRDEILTETELPKKYFAYTPCYRREAGSYRTNERGMIRGHQFNKVEMFQYTLPEGSDDALDELVEKAERLVRGLGLHYRVSKLAAGDCSASMAKTYDIEVWIPSMDEYKEISSASNGYDYQARRGNIRFKRESTGRNEFVHMLNASGLATSRLLPAIAEQFQQADGSIKVPEVLRKWTGTDTLNIIQ